MSRALLLLSLAWLSCATPEQKAQRERYLASLPREADQHIVAECRFLGATWGAATWSGLRGSAPFIAKARTQAIERAAKLGATHYLEVASETDSRGVWTQVNSARVGVRAYECPSQPVRPPDTPELVPAPPPPSQP